MGKTPLTYVTPGYKPDLDRLPPQGAGCNRGCLWMVMLLMLLVGGAGAFIMFASPTQADEELLPTILMTNTPSPVPTATMDYCWFLTPTLEPLPTIDVTLDAIQLRATDDAVKLFRTATATATALPTQEPPMAWCNQPPTLEATATWTPFRIPSDIPHLEAITGTATATPTATATVIPTNVPTSTLFPTLVPQVDQPAQPQQQPERVIVRQTVVVVKNKEVVKVVTATPQPTATFTQTIEVEITEEPTLVPTATPTDIPTLEVTEEPTIEPTLLPTVTIEASLTFTPTFTQTATATATATQTFTATATATHTPTLIPTSTLFPTLEITPNA